MTSDILGAHAQRGLRCACVCVCVCVCLRGRDSMSKVGGLGIHKVGSYSHSF